MKLGFEQAKSTQEFQILVEVVSSALGGKKKKSKPTENYAQAVQQLGSVMNIKELNGRQVKH